MTLRLTLGRTHVGSVSDTDYELPVTVEYVLHPATALEDASVEILGATDDDGNEVTLTVREEQRAMRLAESYRENPVVSLRVE